MKSLLIRLAKWILLHYELDIMAIPVEVKSLMTAASDLVNTLEPSLQSGEWKRHQAYSQMIKMFPGSDKRDLALAIELSLR